MKRVICLLVYCIAFVGYLSAQDNDNCSGAILIEVGKLCHNGNYTNEGATAESTTVAPTPSCGLYKGADVWFKATMPVSGVIRIETDNLESPVQHSVTVYEGSCGNFTEVLCFRQDMAKTFHSPELAGEILYFRVFSLNGAPGTSFNFCVWEPVIPANDNCESAIDIDASKVCTTSTYTNAFATAQSSSIAPEPLCGVYKGGDVWFKTVVQASGSLRVESHNLSGATSKSVVIYTGSCGEFTEKFCLQLDDNKTFYDPDWAGQTVYARVFSFDSEEGGAFELCLFSPNEPLNDNCENAVDLPINENCVAITFSNALATSEPFTVAGKPSCGQYQGGDVWFKVNWPASGKLRLMTKSVGSAIEKSIVLYRGSCGNFTEVACGELESNYSFDKPELVGETIYIRAFTYGNEEGSMFSICTSEINCETITVDAGTITICDGESYSFGSQTLVEAGTFQETFQSVNGCDSIVDITLMVHSVDATVLQDGMTLTATTDNGSYQWVDCNLGNLPIPNETGISLTAGNEGKFAVIVSQNNCTVMSDCYKIEITGIEDELSDGIKIFPNPVMQSLLIQINNYAERVRLELYSSSGKVLVDEHFYNSPNIHIPMEKMQTGVYILRVTTKEKGVRYTVLKN
jgi:hypothetical protein